MLESAPISRLGRLTVDTTEWAVDIAEFLSIFRGIVRSHDTVESAKGDPTLTETLKIVLKCFEQLAGHLYEELQQSQVIWKVLYRNHDGIEFNGARYLTYSCAAHDSAKTLYTLAYIANFRRLPQTIQAVSWNQDAAVNTISFWDQIQKVANTDLALIDVLKMRVLGEKIDIEEKVEQAAKIEKSQSSPVSVRDDVSNFSIHVEYPVEEDGIRYQVTEDRSGPYLVPLLPGGSGFLFPKELGISSLFTDAISHKAPAAVVTHIDVEKMVEFPGLDDPHGPNAVRHPAELESAVSKLDRKLHKGLTRHIWVAQRPVTFEELHKAWKSFTGKSTSPQLSSIKSELKRWKREFCAIVPVNICEPTIREKSQIVELIFTK